MADKTNNKNPVEKLDEEKQLNIANHQRIMNCPYMVGLT